MAPTLAARQPSEGYEHARALLGSCRERANCNRGLALELIGSQCVAVAASRALSVPTDHHVSR